jgi:hypothetical protein
MPVNSTLFTSLSDLFPHFIVNNSQLWHVSGHPLGLRIRSTDAAARFRVLNEGLPIPYHATDVERVLKYAVGTLSAAADCRRIPGPASRSGDPLVVQFSRDIAR